MVRTTAHPGEILTEEFMVPLEFSARALAKAIDASPNRMTSIANGTRSVTADTAIKLGRHFKTTRSGLPFRWSDPFAPACMQTVSKP